ncbi:MAG: glutathione peroxidase [Gemmataceae bacterium]|nr:glutathione peroxidase [Gemmataceae bacterium]
MARADDTKKPALLNFKMKSITGQEVDLSKYQGKVLLVVNVASRCGNTPQYKELEALHEKYADKGLAILGFPCNQFGKQEPGTDAEIAAFCQTKYNVRFDMFSKIDVNGESAAPFFKLLTQAPAKPKGPGPVSWNFEKFVINRQGEVVARFAPKTKPDAPEVIQVIEAELARK